MTLLVAEVSVWYDIEGVIGTTSSTHNGDESFSKE
jgi:hypothetical protein